MRIAKRAAAAALVLACLFGLGGCAGGRHKAPNGAGLDDEVYALLKGRREAEVIRRYSEAYGAEADADFWDKPLEGETPRQKLDALVLEDYHTAQTIFELGQAYELISFEGFDDFFEALAAENQRRARAAAAGETVYGPLEFTGADFLDHTLDNLTVQLPPLMENNELQAGEDALLAYYEGSKEALFRTAARVRVQLLMVPLDPSAEASDGQEVAQAIAAELEGVTGFDELMRRFNPGGEPLEVEIVDNTIARSRYAEAYDLAARTEPGEVGGPLLAEHSVTYVHCLEKELGGVLPYEACGQQVKISYLRQAFDEYIALEVDNRMGSGSGN